MTDNTWDEYHEQRLAELEAENERLRHELAEAADRERMADVQLQLRDEQIDRLQALLPDAETRKAIRDVLELAWLDLPSYDGTASQERANNSVHTTRHWLERLERP